MDTEVKAVDLRHDALAPPDFMTNSLQGEIYKVGTLDLVIEVSGSVSLGG